MLDKCQQKSSFDTSCHDEGTTAKQRLIYIILEPNNLLHPQYIIIVFVSLTLIAMIRMHQGLSGTIQKSIN